MTFEATGKGEIVCRLTLTEANRSAEEGYLTLWPADEAGLEAARREEYERLEENESRIEMEKDTHGNHC